MMPMMIITMPIIIMMMTRMTVAMMVVEAAAARAPRCSKGGENGDCTTTIHFPYTFHDIK